MEKHQNKGKPKVAVSNLSAIILLNAKNSISEDLILYLITAGNFYCGYLRKLKGPLILNRRRNPLSGLSGTPNISPAIEQRRATVKAN